MKKLLSLFVIIAGMALVTTSAQAQSDQELIARAGAAIRQNCPDLIINGGLDGTVEVIGICFVEGFTKRVHVIGRVNCPGNEPCLALSIYYGYVDFFCGGGIINVNCNPY